MISLTQLAANLANAQKSTGPKTAEGKQRTRLNAYRHGLTGEIHIFTLEEQAAFDKHCTGIREALEPVGALELDLAQSIAEDRWRLKRARTLETGIFALGKGALLVGLLASPDDDEVQLSEGLVQARTWLAQGKDLHLLALYEQRIQRAVEKNMAQIRILQTDRKAARQQALEEAQLLAQLAYSKGDRYDPARDFPPVLVANGSDCSNAGINRLIVRNQRLQEARHGVKNRWDAKKPFPDPGFRIPIAA